MSDLCSSDLGNRIIPARRIGNIQPNEERIATSSPDFGYDALGHLFIEVADYDLGAFFSETLRLSGAEPARSTRDERNLACESVSHSSSSENRSAERRVGKEFVSTFRSSWSLYH